MSFAARAETRAGALVWASAPRRRVARVCQNTGRGVRLGRCLSQRGFLLPEAEASARASTFTAVRAGRATDSTTSHPLACIVGAAALLLWRARAKDVARGERKDHGADAADPWKEVEADSLVSGLARELSNVSIAPQLAPPARDAPRPARRMFGAALAAATVAAAAAPNALGGGGRGNPAGVGAPHREVGQSKRDRLARFDDRVQVSVRRAGKGVVVLDARVAVPEATRAQTWRAVRAMALGQVPAGGDGLRDVLTQTSVPGVPPGTFAAGPKRGPGAALLDEDAFDEEATVTRTARYKWGVVKGTSTVATRARVRDRDMTAVIDNVEPERKGPNSSASSPSLERVNSEYAVVGDGVAFRSEFKVADVRVMGISQIEVATRATASILRGSAVKNLGDIARVAADATASENGPRDIRA